MGEVSKQDSTQEHRVLIAVVGPCASGKTTLVEGLQAKGYWARQIAQEHSYVPQMWKLLTKPDILIYVHANYETCTERKQLNWALKDYEIQIERLAHARENCDIYLDTEGISAHEALERALEALKPLIDPLTCRI
jgi:deoxyadenosine/deoxycytidine kinase